jgi:alkylated DNA repair dioxygenase AlkB
MNELRGCCIECGMKPNKCMCTKEPEPFPAPYFQAHEWGWSKAEADEFFHYFNDVQFCEREILYRDKATGSMLPTGNVLGRKSVAYAYDPNHSQVRGTADETAKVVDADHCVGTVFPWKEAPECALNLRLKLTEHLQKIPGYQKHVVNFMAVIKYPDAKAQINWHKHNEDNGINTPTFIVSTGAERLFHLGLRKGKKGTPAERWSRIAEHGSLIYMPASFNDTHLHAILPEDGDECGPRISVATKCLLAPRVFSLKLGWGHYPSGAIYVGCRYPGVHQAKTPLKEGTVYGNDYEPTKGHYKPIAKTADEFRKYALERMSDPAFRAQAIKDLRGKHLLCFCLPSNPHCHARVWMDIVNGPEYAEVKP